MASVVKNQTNNNKKKAKLMDTSLHGAVCVELANIVKKIPGIGQVICKAGPASAWKNTINANNTLVTYGIMDELIEASCTSSGSRGVGTEQKTMLMALKGSENFALLRRNKATLIYSPVQLEREGRHSKPAPTSWFVVLSDLNDGVNLQLSCRGHSSVVGNILELVIAAVQSACKKLGKKSLDIYISPVQGSGPGLLKHYLSKGFIIINADEGGNPPPREQLALCRTVVQ